MTDSENHDEIDLSLNPPTTCCCRSSRDPVDSTVGDQTFGEIEGNGYAEHNEWNASDLIIEDLDEVEHPAPMRNLSGYYMFLIKFPYH